MTKRPVTNRGVCIQVASQTFGSKESCYPHERKLNAESGEVPNWLTRLTNNHSCSGFGLCSLDLWNVNGSKWNHKHVYQVYEEQAPTLRSKPRKRLVREKPEVQTVPQSVTQVSSLDFMYDQFEHSRSLRRLDVITDFNV